VIHEYEPSSPLRLKAGRGFESQATRHTIGDCIVVDAQISAGLRAPPHAHEQAYFTLILAGGFQEQYGAVTWNGVAGAMNFVPSGVPHATVSGGARLVRIEFPETALAEARLLGPVLDQPAAFHHPAIVSLASRILAEVRGQHPGWRLVVQGLLLELLGNAARDQVTASAGRIPAWLRIVKDRLDAEWCKPVSLGQLAVAAGVHPMHLARGFRMAFGSSVGEYKRRRQVLAAERQLLASTADLAEVALNCGFSDQSQLSKAFRREFGAPPGRYRRTHRQLR
jgi:AraC family transcriptional regulator